MRRQLTLMLVHAHPDDEVVTTGGILARHSLEGVRTVLVTCNNGEQGDGPDGEKPGPSGHSPSAVARIRLAELRASVTLLQVEEPVGDRM
jgi:LmbE family N-acetylglucosaminyl deacetylase